METLLSRHKKQPESVPEPPVHHEDEQEECYPVHDPVGPLDPQDPFPPPSKPPNPPDKP